MYANERLEQAVGPLVNRGVFQQQSDVVAELGAFEPELCANQIFQGWQVRNK